MFEMPQSLSAWECRKGSAVLNRRYSFASYRDTRDFLDQMADYSKQTGQHPNTLNFGTTYVNLTLEGQGEMPDEGMLRMAEEIEAMFVAFTGQAV